MLKGKEFQNHEIVTKRKLYDYCNLPEDAEDEFREELYNEQLEYVATEIKTDNVIIHIIEDDAFLNEHYLYVSTPEIDSCIQYLAIKDGFDLVRFSNGNLGFVAYYNGYENGFEIIPTEMTEDEFYWAGNDMDWQDYIYN